MPFVDLSSITDVGIDEAVRQPFAAIWPTVGEVIDRFSRATRSPLSLYLNTARLYGPEVQTYPRVCQLLLADAHHATRCRADDQSRAVAADGGGTPGDVCYAGMRVERRSFEVEGLGTFTILLSGMTAHTREATLSRQQLLDEVDGKDASLAFRLREAIVEAPLLPEEADIALLDALTKTIQSLLTATVGFQALAINLVHEVALMLDALGLLTRDISRRSELANGIQVEETLRHINAQAKRINAECRLGLYMARNFLSHASDQRFAASMRTQREIVDLAALVEDFAGLYMSLSRTKDLVFDLGNIDELPRVAGHEMELRRLLHNVFSNAVKYSYHSVGESRRTVRVRAKVPYDAQSRRFALVVENYGLGLTEEEQRLAFRPGFRGQQARREQPIGVGIGLTETQKIMKMHGGTAKIRSRLLHGDGSRQGTYLTQVELIFPMLDRNRSQ